MKHFDNGEAVSEAIVPLSTYLIFLYRYSNTLLVTFNNRIALRNVGQTVYENRSGSGGRTMPLRSKDFTTNSNNASFRVAPSFSVHSSGPISEEYEIQVRHTPEAFVMITCYRLLMVRKQDIKAEKTRTFASVV